MRILNLIFAALCMVACASAAPPQPASATDPMPRTLSWSELEKIPLPPAAPRIAYGPAPQQFGELRVPEGTGPFPLVMLIHGGCWLADFDYVHITRLAAALTPLGYASWTIEYRRLGDPGGGWPNTLLDVARAADHVRTLARSHPLDLTRVVSMGHSAGGQLALWLAARGKLPADSALYLKNPLPLTGVVGLAAITDLETYRIGPPDSCNASVDQLLGGPPQQFAQRYAQTSPLALLPLGLPQWLIQGERDRIVPAPSVRAYAQAALSNGDPVTLMPLAGAGHFEVVAPQAPAWPAVVEALNSALKKPSLKRSRWSFRRERARVSA